MHPSIFSNKGWITSLDDKDLLVPPVTPLSQSSFQSAISSLSWKPTYASIIQENGEILSNRLQKYVVSQPITELYEIRRSIGNGQFGKVYKAYNKQSNRAVAVKMVPKRTSQQYSMNQIMRQVHYWREKENGINLSSDQAIESLNVEKCRWEVYILSTLKGSSYVTDFYQCIDSSATDKIYIINEYCNLGELKWNRYNDELLKEWKYVLPGCKNVEQFATKVLQDMTRALLFLKEKGIVHRDIKPSNILLDSRSETLKLSDFGSSVMIPSKLAFIKEESNVKLLEQVYIAELSKIVGTPAFIAPELCEFSDSKGEKPRYEIDNGFKLDIWSLGVTIYCILNNKLPFYGDNEFETYHEIINKELSHGKEMSTIHNLVVQRLLKKSAKERIEVEELFNILFVTKTTGSKFSKILNKLKKGTTKTKRRAEERSVSARMSISSSESSSSYEEPVNIDDFIDKIDLIEIQPPQSSKVAATSGKTRLAHSQNVINFKDYLGMPQDHPIAEHGVASSQQSIDNINEILKYASQGV